MPTTRRQALARLAGLAAAAAAGSTAAAPAGTTAAAATPADADDAAAQPLAARFAVTTTSAASAGKPAVQRSGTWTLHRDAGQVALLKGAIDEIWQRDAQGRLSFQRVFHEHGKVTDYSAGELATLGIDADWNALATLVGARERAALKQTARSGRGVLLRLRLEGGQGGERVRVDWLPALQLPALVLRTRADGSSSRIELLAHADQAPADWPQPGQRAAGYLHLDAADFGDMDYEPVVRLSEALDVRSGWRQPHAHD